MAILQNWSLVVRDLHGATFIDSAASGVNDINMETMLG
jgi:hypothetical protein